MSTRGVVRLSQPLLAPHVGSTEGVCTTAISITGLHTDKVTTTAAASYTWPPDKKQIRAAATMTSRTLTTNHDSITARP